MSDTIETRLTMAQFIARMALRMTAEYTDRNPNMNDDNMDHWRCVISCGRRRMTLVFSMGLGHRGAEPKLAEVLDCIASDAASALEDFADWCSNLGYSEDSRKAERVYKACQRQAVSLRRLLGSTAAYETLLFRTERV